MYSNYPRIIKKVSCLLIVLVIFPVFVFAQQTAFTPEDALNVKNIRFQDMTDDGRYIAMIVYTHRDRLNVDHFRFGDPTYISPFLSNVIVLDSDTKEQFKLFEQKVQVGRMSWSPDGKTLAFLLRKDDQYFLHTWDTDKKKVKEIKPKTTKQIASNSILEWRTDGSGIILFLRQDGWAQNAREKYEYLENGPIIVQDSRKPFLAWDEVRNLSSLVIPAVVNLKKRDVRELMPEINAGQFRQSENGDFLTYVETTLIKTSYTRRDGTEYELFKLDMTSGESKSIREKTKTRLRLNWNDTNDGFAYSEKGNVFVQSVDENEAKNITKDFKDTVSEEDTTKLRYSMMRWSPDNSKLLISSQKGYHLFDTNSSTFDLVYKLPEDNENAPSQSVTEWSNDGRYLYMTYSAKDKWDRGLVKYDLQSRRMEDLVKSKDLFSGWRFSKDGNKIIYSFSDGDKPTDLYSADKDMNFKTRLTDFNPWLKDRLLTRSELIEYMDIDGKKLHGILHYPVNYEPGKKYPLVCEVYENYFNNGFNHRMNLFANAGFFGFRVSANLEEGFPGEGWVKGITVALNKLIERGLVDKDKLGVQGTSYGGYATNLIITQTDRFAAACNISGKVNIISFLGDSPKITNRNYAAAEVGQDRIGATLWEQPQKYLAHTAILYADRIKTPLLMLTGEGDWNVPATNQREMYYALRRLGKECIWVNYMKAGHGAGRSGRVDDFHHHWKTLIDFYNEKFEEAGKKKK